MAYTLSLTLKSLKQFPETNGLTRPIGVLDIPQREHQNWADRREEALSSTTPHVVIIGAGHSGLMLAARLKRLGVHVLVIEKTKRVGDCWRNRYRSLVLHNGIWANEFPYLRFPDDWPVFLPKDKVADWMECYARLLDLNIVRFLLFARVLHLPTITCWGIVDEFDDCR